MDWQAQRFRATILTQEPYIVDSINWWEDLIGTKPDSILSYPNKYGIQQQGIFESHNLIIDIKPERVDWTMTAREVDSKSPSKLPITIGLFNDNIQLFSDLVNKWLSVEDLPITSRVAFGANLLLPVEDVVSGYKILNKLLPNVKLDFSEPSDFYFQINRKRHSKINISDLIINRLSKWSVLKTRLFLMSPDQSTNIKHIDSFACQLELDINSLKIEESIPNNQLINLFNELVEYGKEISQKGDII